MRAAPLLLVFAVTLAPSASRAQTDEEPEPLLPFDDDPVSEAPLVLRLPPRLAEALEAPTSLEVFGLLRRAPDPDEEAVGERPVHRRVSVADPVAVGRALKAACREGSSVAKSPDLRPWTVRLRHGGETFVLEVDDHTLGWRPHPLLPGGLSLVPVDATARTALEAVLPRADLAPPADWVEERPLEVWEARVRAGAPGPTRATLLSRLAWRPLREDGALARPLVPAEADVARRRRLAALLDVETPFRATDALALAPAAAGERDPEVRARVEALLARGPESPLADRTLVGRLLGLAGHGTLPPEQRAAAVGALLQPLRRGGLSPAHLDRLRALADGPDQPALVREAAAAALEVPRAQD